MKYQNFLNKLFLPGLFYMFTWQILEQNTLELVTCSFSTIWYGCFSSCVYFVSFITSTKTLQILVTTILAQSLNKAVKKILAIIFMYIN